MYSLHSNVINEIQVHNTHSLYDSWIVFHCEIKKKINPCIIHSSHS